MPGNKGVVYEGPGKVEVGEIGYPEFELKDGPGVHPANVGRKLPHAAILRTVATNICGSDQHMVRGRTTAPRGLVLGHEITGEVVETGPDVEFVKIGDLVSVPFNISCGRCRNCKEGKTGICENVNPDRPGSAYGYVDMGGWVGGQAEYALVPYADWNLLKFPDKDRAMEKILDLAHSFGCETVNVALGEPKDQIEHILGTPEVDCAVDAVGFEAHGHGHEAEVERPATVLNTLMDVTRAGGALGIPGLYVTGDPGAVDEAAKQGSLSIRFGLGWAKSHSIATGQCPVMRYNRQLMEAILHDRVQIAKAVNATAIPLDEAPRGYREFDQGAAHKYVLDPNGLLGTAA
ncbi:formaldehyde dehydrogenase, glutathione-independent [Nonomuraea antimicrobica]|uniref:Formaldehyde dehydrogenase, glutathione-independent n=1 Tax=Nonomuraea antimicrobica TaxID=561173 RepID=A0ABP7AXA6_9ACTN